MGKEPEPLALMSTESRPLLPLADKCGCEPLPLIGIEPLLKGIKALPLVDEATTQNGGGEDRQIAAMATQSTRKRIDAGAGAKRNDNEKKKPTKRNKTGRI